MTEEELRERLDRLEEIHRRRRDDILFPNEKELHEIRAAIIAAFAEIRDERDYLRSCNEFDLIKQIVDLRAERDTLRRIMSPDQSLIDAALVQQEEEIAKLRAELAEFSKRYGGVTENPTAKHPTIIYRERTDAVSGDESDRWSRLVAERDAALDTLKEKQDWLDLNASLNAKFIIQLALYREAILDLPEWDANYHYHCMWCTSSKGQHAPDCLRQRALAGKEIKDNNA